MSRFLLLLVFVGWMSWTSRWPGPSVAPFNISPSDPLLCAIFIVGYVLLIGLCGWWCRWLANRLDGSNISVTLKRFNRAMTVARLAVPLWFFAGIYLMNWGTLVAQGLAQIGLSPARYDTPGLLIGSLPALFAWAGLWWSQYPADISFREQGLLSQLDAGLPIHRPPSLRTYLLVNFRLQLLFTIVPVLVLVLLRDLLSLALAPLGLNQQNSLAIQLGISLTTAAVVLLFAPEILKRVLHTESMPPGVLRHRLEAICRRHNIRYKDVLLWRTEYNMGNAAVMGLIPPMRYILMSDLLLETMTDEQIEAVFAHEVGHIIHHHMLWFAVFFGALMFALVGLSGPLGNSVEKWLPDAALPNALQAIAGVTVFLSLFFFISRRFERQADVFAARTIQEELSGHADPSHVGQEGANIFCSALQQVARINCIPLTAWSAGHGSIARRMDYLRSLSIDPTRTAKFDAFMSRLYAILIVALCGSSVAAAIALVWQRAG
jgi:STE24 endopeptidase